MVSYSDAPTFSVLMPGLCVSVDTRYQSGAIFELTINCIPVLEKYLRDGREYLGSKYSSRRQKPLPSTTGWASKTMNSENFYETANAFNLSNENFSHLWGASAKVNCWTILSPAPLVLLGGRTSAYMVLLDLFELIGSIVLCSITTTPRNIYFADIANSHLTTWRCKREISPHSRLFGSLHVA